MFIPSIHLREWSWSILNTPLPPVQIGGWMNTPEMNTALSLMQNRMVDGTNTPLSLMQIGGWNEHSSSIDADWWME